MQLATATCDTAATAPAHDCLCCGAPLSDDACGLCFRPAPHTVNLTPAARKLLTALRKGTQCIGPRSQWYRLADSLTAIGACFRTHTQQKTQIATYAITLYGRALKID